MNIERKWKGVTSNYLTSWNTIFNDNKESINISDECPICSHISLHHYYHSHLPIDKEIDGVRYISSGSLWEWCSNCLHYIHYSSLVPDWWKCDLEVDENKLTAEPEAIEKALKEYELQRHSQSKT